MVWALNLRFSFIYSVPGGHVHSELGVTGG